MVMVECRNEKKIGETEKKGYRNTTNEQTLQTEIWRWRALVLWAIYSLFFVLFEEHKNQKSNWSIVNDKDLFSGFLESLK